MDKTWNYVKLKNTIIPLSRLYYNLILLGINQKCT